MTDNNTFKILYLNLGPKSLVIFQFISKLILRFKFFISLHKKYFFIKQKIRICNKYLKANKIPKI